MSWSDYSRCEPCRLRRDGFAIALCLAALIASAVHPAEAAVIEAWAQTYNSVGRTANDGASEVVRDAAGDIIVAGSTDNRTTGRDMLTIKYAGTDGTVIWQQRYNGPANNQDIPQALAVDGSGNVFVAGYSRNGTNSDYYTAKYAGMDGALLWEKRYNGPAGSDDSAQAAVVDSSGNVVVTGTSSSGAGTNDYYTAKYAAADGALLWEQRYNGPANGDDRVQAMALDASGNVLVTGYSPGIGSGWDYYTAKYAAADGALLWEKRYNGPANGSDLPRAVAVDTIGNVVVTGNSTVSAGVSESYTAKYAATDGGLLWEKQFTNSASSLAVDSSGDVVVTGASSGSGSSSESYTAKYAATDGGLLWEQRSTNGAYFVALDNNGNVVMTGATWLGNHGVISTAKYAAADGSLLWEWNHGRGRVNSPTAIIVSGDGEVVVTSTIESTSHKDFDWYTVKYAAGDGALLWEKRYDGPANFADFGRAVAVDRNGNVVVTGDSITIKYAAANGAELWKKPRANAVAIDGNGNVVLAGDFYNFNGNHYDFSTAKYAPNGELIWEQRYDGPASKSDQTKAVVVDSDGNVVVTGQSYNESNRDHYAIDFYTARYSSADGALLWEQRYNGPTNSYDSPTALTVDADGNVVVTGFSYSGFFIGAYDFEDYYTAKYAATDGALLWEQRYNGPANRNDTPQAVAVDKSGNVAVTGSSHNGSNNDYYTAKYAAANGALLWEKRYNGPANSNDTALAVAVDGTGNVIVTGGSYGSGGTSDYYTAKYAAADGSLLWEKRYNGPANTHDAAQKMAVDGGGNVVVTGSSGPDYYTAKYVAEDGALVWEKRYSTPPNRSMYAAGLALGPDGMIAVTGFYYSSFVNGILPDLDYATVVYQENLSRVAIDRVPGGIRLCFTGTNGRSYEIQRAGTVTGPWSTLAVPIAPLDGIIEYLDASPLSGAAYYRIATAP